jgi:hypothetical protein
MAVMSSRLDTLLDQIRQLEKKVSQEARKKEAEFCYKVHAGRVEFTTAVTAEHKKLRLSIHRYLTSSRLLVLLTGPFIWLCLIPLLFMDVIGSIYQALCFPIYGIPKVRRHEYVTFDRHRLAYLNFFEKLNCEYCAYANGILAYFTEIAARTEQHFCPIKHAGCVKCAHSRYQNFVDFGDAQAFRQHGEEISHAYQDIQASEADQKKE